jgi:hypothetical protein
MSRIPVRRWLLCAAVLLALAAALPGAARADWDDRPDPSEYEESLSPYGYWADAPGYGRVWRPNEDWNWRPYVDGQWIWSSYGWTWSSPEPWGWTFHYGRWGWANTYGWVWTPGYTWGPAWVDWYWGDGYVGWVPLAPAGFAVTPGYWNYVRDYSFCAPRINTVVIAPNRLPNYIVHHREQGWGRQREPDFRDIELVSRHRIVRENDRPSDSVAPWVRHRIERGEPVRERIDDRGRERVIEHAGRQTNLQGPNGRDRDRPAVSNDDWRRRGSDDGGQMLGRNRGQDDRELTNRTLEHRRDGDDRGNRPEVVDVPRRPGNEGGGDRRVGPRVDDDRELTRPRPSGDGSTAWSRPQPQPDVRVPRVDPGTSPGVMYRGGGGAAPGGTPGGPMIIQRSPGGGHAAGPTMQHGGGGGAPSASPGSAPGGRSGGSMGHAGGGAHGGGGGGGGTGGGGGHGGGGGGGGFSGGGSMSR